MGICRSPSWHIGTHRFQPETITRQEARLRSLRRKSLRAPEPLLPSVVEGSSATLRPVAQAGHRSQRCRASWRRFRNSRCACVGTHNNTSVKWLPNLPSNAPPTTNRKWSSMQQSKIRSPRATRRQQVERPKAEQTRMLERRPTAMCQEPNRTKTFPTRRHLRANVQPSRALTVGVSL